MAWTRRAMALGVWGGLLAVLTGCVGSLPDSFRPSQSLASDITWTPEATSARGQLPDRGASLPPIDPRGILPPPPPKSAAPSGIQQASVTSRGQVRVSIRAWVNGVPIYDDEVMNMAGPELRKLMSARGNEGPAKMAELMRTVVESLIDQEVMYQDAMKKLSKASPAGLKELNKFVDHQFDKQMQRYRDVKPPIPEEKIKEVEPIARRLLARSLVSTEYARSRIMDIVKAAINIDLIREYYETHKNEFQTVDKVVWQNIFIKVSPNLPTVADAKRFAEELIAKCKVPDDFNKLMVYNEGPTSLNNGEGFGARVGHRDKNNGKWIAGDIRPAELDEPLSKLRENEIGPVIAFPNGVHLMRVVKREYAAQLPLDDKVQNTIRKMLESELADREYKRIVRELRARAIIRIESP